MRPSALGSLSCDPAVCVRVFIYICICILEGCTTNNYYFSERELAISIDLIHIFDT